MPPKSAFWQFFEKKDNNTAICLCCGKTLKTSGNTTNLRSHIESKHGGPRNLLSIKRSTKKLRSISFPCTPSIEIVPKTEDLNGAEVVDNSFHFSYGSDYSTSLESLLKQSTQHGSLQGLNTTRENDDNFKITNNILYMMCKDGDSFSLVEHRGFNRLIKSLAPNYSMPSKEVMENLFLEKYDAISSVLKTRLKGITDCTLTINTWTIFEVKCFSNLTLHFLEEHSTHQTSSYTIGTFEVHHEYSTDHVAQNIKNMCDKWNISEDQILAVVTNSTPIVAAGVEIAFDPRKHIPCFANMLNLFAEMAMANVSEFQMLQKRVKEVVMLFKKNASFNEEWIRQNDKKLLVNDSNHWLHNLHMFQMIVELQSGIVRMSNHSLEDPKMLTKEEISDLMDVCLVLQPLESVVKEISTPGEYLMGSMVIPLVHILRDKIIKLEPKGEIGMKLRQHLLSDCDSRFNTMERLTALAAATFLDPRFKIMYFRDKTAINNVVHFVGNSIVDQDVKCHLPSGGRICVEFFNILCLMMLKEILVNCDLTLFGFIDLLLMSVFM